MKWMIASDIHGSALYCGRLLEALRREEAGRLLLLGDLLYHGPRNDLPDGYAPKEVIDRLNALSPAPLCVRGNCEAEVDQMVLHFPVMADYALLYEAGRVIFATHGHLYNQEHLPPLSAGDVLLNGHTHVAGFVRHEDYLYVNPGSPSLPKEDTPRGYLILENGVFCWKKLDGEEYLRLEL